MTKRIGTVKRLHLAVLTCLIILSLCSLAACPASKNPSQLGLRIGLETAPQRLDPRYGLDAASFRVSQLLYNGLVRLDERAQLVPQLALSWETPSPTTYVFRLRSDVLWHDGRPFTAADVHYTFSSILDPATESPKRGRFDKIKAMQILADDAIQFELSEPFAPFLPNNMIQAIVPNSRVDDTARDLDMNPVGTGPFVFVAQEPDVSLQLRANETYFEGKPALESVTLRVVPDAMVRLFELQKGNIDLLQNALPVDLLTQLVKDREYDVLQAPGTDFMYIGLNCKDDILRHVMVRQALAHAIDRPRLIRHVMQGLAEPADGVFPAGHWAYEAKVARYPYDLKRAAQLLDAAGFPDPDGEGPKDRFRLQYKTSQNEVGRRIAEVVQESLRQVGVTIEIRSYEWGTFFGDIRAGNFQMYALTWVGVTEPDHFHYILHSHQIPPVGANRGYYANPRLDALLERGRRITQLERRRAIYSQVQSIVANDLPYIPLWHQTNVAVLHHAFKNYRLTPGGDFWPIRSIRRQSPVTASSF